MQRVNERPGDVTGTHAEGGREYAILSNCLLPIIRARFRDRPIPGAGLSGGDWLFAFVGMLCAFNKVPRCLGTVLGGLRTGNISVVIIAPRGKGTGVNGKMGVMRDNSCGRLADPRGGVFCKGATCPRLPRVVQGRRPSVLMVK